MANCLLCWPNRIDAATLSGGSWLSALPLSNVKSRFRAAVARSSDLDESSLEINIDLGSKKYITSVAIAGHNLSATASVRFRAFSDAAMTTAIYDSGYVDAWPRWYDTLQLRWSDENFWSGRITEAQRAAMPALWLHMISNGTFVANATSMQYAKINFKDDANEDGHIQLSRVFMAEDFCPVTNFVYGATLGWSDPSTVDTALDGTEYFESRTKYREVLFQLKYMSLSEGANKALMMTLDRGITKDFLFVFDPSNQQLMQQRSFIGRMSELSPLEYAMFSRNNMQFKLKEMI